MNRELPVLVVETSSLNISKEYVLTNHAITLKKYGSVLLSEFAELPIVTYANTFFNEFIVSPSSLVDMNVEAFVVFSSAVPQTVASAENLIYLYRNNLGDVGIAEVFDQTFTDLLPQSIYEGISTTYETSTFDSIYNSQPKQYQEYIKVIPATTTELNNLSVDREIVVRSEGNGFKYSIYDDLLLSDYESAPISTLSDITFDAFLDTVYDTTIKATTSPYSGGQSARRNPTDIFRNETELEIQTEFDGYALPYGDLPVSALSEYAISGTLYDRPLSAETFGTTYPSLYTASDYTSYVKIAGTVFSANAEFSTLSISSFSSTPIGYVDGSILSGLAPLVVGGTTGLTQTAQNIAGANSNTGFFFYGWADDPGSNDLTFSSIQVGWTVVGQPTWVVTAVGDGTTNYDVTISGGEFVSGTSYQFTGTIIGGTDFVTDFSLGSVLVANNEYFTVDGIANTSYLVTDRLPANAFSGVVAYKISA